jgi:hypothetical protein
VEYVSTHHNASDMFTKLLPKTKFSKCLQLLGIG